MALRAANFTAPAARSAASMNAVTAAPHTAMAAAVGILSVRLSMTSPNMLPSTHSAVQVTVYFVHDTEGHFLLSNARLSTAVIKLLPASPVMYEYIPAIGVKINMHASINKAPIKK